MPFDFTNITGPLALVAGHSANQKEYEMFHENLAFQREMAETGMQKRVKDLYAAGLNPMMAYGHMGAAQASGGTSVPHQENIGDKAGQQFLATALQAVERKAIEAGTMKTKAEEALAINSAGKADAERRFIESQIPGTPGRIAADTAHSGAAAAKMTAELNEIAARVEDLKEARNLKEAERYRTEAETIIKRLDANEKAQAIPLIIDMMKAELRILDAKAPGYERQRDAMNSWWRQQLALWGFTPGQQTEMMDRSVGTASYMIQKK